MPSKNQKQPTAILPPKLAQAALTTEFPGGLPVDNGVYAELVVAQAAISSHTAADVTFESVRLDHVRLNATRLSRAHWRDARFETCDLAEADWDKTQLTRVEIVESRLLGFKAAEARIQDTLVKNCNGKLALFFGATFKRVRFTRCQLNEASFQEADLTGVVFDHCDLRQASFQGAKLMGTDFRGSNVEGLRVGSQDVAGAIIDPAQAVVFASALGLIVKWDD